MPSVPREKLESFILGSVLSHAQSEKVALVNRKKLGITLDTPLEQLGLDSLDTLGVIMDTEFEYQVSIPDSFSEREDIRFGSITIGSLIESLATFIEKTPQ